MTRILFALVFFSSTLIASTANSTSIKDVTDAVKTNATQRANKANLPSPYAFHKYKAPSKLAQGECQYSAHLHFTITALKGHPFNKLFSETELARTIVSEWHKNTADFSDYELPVFMMLGQLVEDLKSELDKTQYDNFYFWEMVDLRLTRKFKKEMHPLDDVLNNLVKAGFQFPLFDVGSRTSVEDRYALLKDFVKYHTKKSTGGLGNLNWVQLFHTPATPYDTVKDEGFSEDFIYRIVSPMHDEIIPRPTVECKSKITTFTVNNSCCCNEGDHTNHEFRKCTGFPGLNCVPPGGYCAIGSHFCPESHPDN